MPDEPPGGPYRGASRPPGAGAVERGGREEELLRALAALERRNQELEDELARLRRELDEARARLAAG